MTSYTLAPRLVPTNGGSTMNTRHSDGHSNDSHVFKVGAITSVAIIDTTVTLYPVADTHVVCGHHFFGHHSIGSYKPPQHVLFPFISRSVPAGTLMTSRYQMKGHYSLDSAVAAAAEFLEVKISENPPLRRAVSTSTWTR